MLGLGLTQQSTSVSSVTPPCDRTVPLTTYSIVWPVAVPQGSHAFKINLWRNNSGAGAGNPYYTYQAVTEGNGTTVNDRQSGTAEIVVTDQTTLTEYVATAYIFLEYASSNLQTFKLGPLDEATLSDETFAATDFTPNMPIVPSGEFDADYRVKIRLKAFGDVDVDGCTYTTSDGPYPPVSGGEDAVFIILGA